MLSNMRKTSFRIYDDDDDDDDDMVSTEVCLS